MSRVHDLQREVRALKSAIAAIHNHLHADDVNAAHEACECAISGERVTQPNLTEGDGAQTMDFAVAFNALAEHYRVNACSIVLVPSATVRGAVSVQILGAVSACRIVEGMMRGSASTYMGDHQREKARERSEWNDEQDALRRSRGTP